MKKTSIVSAIAAALVVAAIGYAASAVAQMQCPQGYYPVGQGMCCPIGTIPFVGPYGAMQCK